ncbi:MAG TPA: hypothetical protein VGU20_05775 [Stellaceae bacterium]|nr:hypothetical protein [Stellaceae bacterium]
MRCLCPLSGAAALCLAALAIAGCGLALAGCGLRLREATPLDRCAELMQQAFPGGDIKPTKKEVVEETAPSIATVVARIEGERRNVAAGGVPRRDVAAECRFENGILTGFRWTKGPLR